MHSMMRTPRRAWLTKALAVLVALATMSLVALSNTGTAAAAPRTADAASVPISGTLADGTGDVAGTFDVTRFANQGGTLTAIGTFTGTVTDAAGNTVSGSDQIAVPVNLQQSSGSCEILNLIVPEFEVVLMGLTTVVAIFEFPIRRSPIGPGRSVTLLHPVT